MPTNPLAHRQKNDPNKVYMVILTHDKRGSGAWIEDTETRDVDKYFTGILGIWRSRELAEEHAAKIRLATGAEDPQNIDKDVVAAFMEKLQDMEDMERGKPNHKGITQRKLVHVVETSIFNRNTPLDLRRCEWSHMAETNLCRPSSTIPSSARDSGSFASIDD